MNFKDIEKAKDWKILKPFGGNVDINDYRDNFNNISEDYNYLKPPMVSRYAQIEKINLLNNSNNNELLLKEDTIKKQ